MGADKDKDYVEYMRRAVDTARKLPQSGGGFNQQWSLHLEVAIQVSTDLRKHSTRRKDVPPLLRTFFLAMANMVRKEMFDKGHSCDIARASVSRGMLNRGAVVKDPVVVQAWRGAASLLEGAGDDWVSGPAAGLPHACIGGDETWAACVSTVEDAVDSACDNRAKPNEIPALFGTFFGKLALFAHEHCKKKAVPWPTAKQHTVGNALAAPLPTDPVRAVTYIAAAMLLEIVPDNARPEHQLAFANYYASGSASGLISKSTLVGLAVATAALAESTPGQDHHRMVPINADDGVVVGGGGGGPLPPDTTRNAFQTTRKPPSTAEAGVVAATSLGVVGGAAAAAPAPVMAAAEAGQVVRPNTTKRHRGSGASVLGSGASNSTKGNAPAASGTVKWAAARGVGTEAYMPAKEHTSNLSQRMGAVKYGSRKIFGVLPKTSGRIEALGKGVAPAGPAVASKVAALDAAALQAAAWARVAKVAAQRAERTRMATATMPPWVLAARLPPAVFHAAVSAAASAVAAKRTARARMEAEAVTALAIHLGFESEPVPPPVPAAVTGMVASTSAAAERVAAVEAALAGGAGLTTDPTPSKHPQVANTPPKKEYEIPDPLGLSRNGSLDPLAPSPDSAQAASAAGSKAGTFLSANRPSGKTTKDNPTLDSFSVAADLDPSMYSGGSGGGGSGGSGGSGGGGDSRNKRKASVGDGSDCDEARYKKICSASVAGDMFTGEVLSESTYTGGGSADDPLDVSTYIGGGDGGGSAFYKKRKSDSSDGYDTDAGPNKKICCA